MNEAKAHLRSHPDHKAEVICHIAAVKAKGLPQHGKEREQTYEVLLSKLARAVGLKAASSICRHLRRAKMVQRKKQAYAPSRFKAAAPEGVENFEEQYYKLPKLKDLKNLKLPVKFGDDVKGGHYYHSPAWLNHQNSGIPKHPYIVMEYLLSRGLLQMRHGKMVYAISISLRQISRSLALHPEAVRRAIKYWEGKVVYDVAQRRIPHLSSPVLRFVRSKREKYTRADGSTGYKRKPSRIVYVAENKFTQDMAAEELERFIRAAQELKGDPIWRARAEDIHIALLKAWVDTERHLATLWRDSRKKMAERGLPQDVIDALIPPHPS
ncbi:MAG: hypothetical protein ACJ71W_05890 [Terriglobales bacterium]